MSHHTQPGSHFLLLYQYLLAAIVASEKSTEFLLFLCNLFCFFLTQGLTM
jgi:hypothetical protein